MFKPNINLFIVGAAKSGTTSLYHYLNQHESVFFPQVKEPNYYSNIFSEDKQAYKKPKPNKFYHHKIINSKKEYFLLYKGSESYSIVGDASPSYLWDLNSAARIHKDFPNAKIIIILRNPIQRAFSHYLMNLRSGLEQDRNFYSALLRDQKNSQEVWGDGKSMLYVSLGMYSSQIQSYYNYFDKNNIKVLLYEEFFENLAYSVTGLFKFLNISNSKDDTLNLDTSFNAYASPKNKLAELLIKHKQKLGFIRKFAPPMLKQNILFKSSEKPKIDDKTYNYLAKIYKKDIEKLEEILGRNLSLWK